MTAEQLAELNGLLAIAVRHRLNRAAGLEEDKVTDMVLAEIGAPDLALTLDRLVPLAMGCVR